MYIVVIAPQLYFSSLQAAENQHLATHKVADAMRFDSKLDALEFIRANNLTASARPVLLPAVESR